MSPSADRPVRRRRRALARCAMVVGALGVGLGLCELFVRCYREGGLWAGVRSLAADTPLPRDLGAGDWLAPDAARGYVLRAGINGVDALHIRHAEIRVKAAAAWRLLLLGDSVAWPPDGFAALVERGYAAAHADGPLLELVNAAVPGYTTWQEARHLDAILAPVAPDAVVLQYCCNDNHRQLHQLAAGGGWLITAEARRALLPEGDGLWLRLARWSYLALELRRLALARTPAADDWPWRGDAAFAAAWREDSWPLVEGEIEHMATAVRASGARFCVVAVPYEAQLRPDLLARDAAYVTRPQRHLAAICERLDVPFLDLAPAFARSTGERLYTDGIHLTPAGHAAAAAELGPFLTAHGLLP